MTVEEYMRLHLAGQERIVALLEQMVANQDRAIQMVPPGVQFALQPNHQAETHTVGGVSETKVTPVREKSGDELLGEDKAAMKREAAQRQMQEAAATATAAAGSTATGASAPARSTARQESSGSSSKSAPSEGAADVSLKKGDGSKITADDARKAVKAFAAVEGNDAALELLNSFGGAGSVSAVADQGETALATLYWKAGGK